MWRDRTAQRRPRMVRSFLILSVPEVHTSLLMKTQVTPLVVYSTYVAVKLHFEKGSYDAFKYNFKGPQKKIASFQKSNDRFAYEKLAKKYHNFQDLVFFLVANVLAGHTWIRDMTDETYVMWTAKMQRLSYQFSADMQVLHDHAVNHDLTFDLCLVPHNSTNVVPILKLLDRGLIQVESVIIIDVLVDFLSRINKKTVSDPLGITNGKVYLMQQYTPFIKQRINVAASKNIIINLFS